MPISMLSKEFWKKRGLPKNGGSATFLLNFFSFQLPIHQHNLLLLPLVGHEQQLLQSLHLRRL